VGRDINRIFTGFVSREFGRDAFEVHRIDTDETPIDCAAQASVRAKTQSGA